MSSNSNNGQTVQPTPTPEFPPQAYLVFAVTVIPIIFLTLGYIQKV